MSLSLYSKTNVSNSLAVYLAGKLLEAGYLVYWHTTDALQTPTEWWVSYFTNQETYLADTGLQTELEASKGIVAVVPAQSAIPRFVTRPIYSGTIPDYDSIPVPALAIAVGDIVNDGPYELGSLKQWRARPIGIEAFARDEAEQGTFSDYLTEWLDITHIDIKNHDDESLDLVDALDVEDLSVDSIIDLDEAESTTFEIICNARLVFVA